MSDYTGICACGRKAYRKSIGLAVCPFCDQIEERIRQTDIQAAWRKERRRDDPGGYDAYHTSKNVSHIVEGD